MSRFSALLDACVLVPVAQADTLLRLAAEGLYRPLWSDEILQEMVGAIERIHPELADGRAQRRADQMDHAFPDARVEGWEALQGELSLPDPDDTHVLAAAVRGRADLIVTNNLADFPCGVLDPLGMETQSADGFLLDQLDLAPQATLSALAKQASAARQPPLTVREVLDRLERCGARQFSALARGQLWRIEAEGGANYSKKSSSMSTTE